MLSPKAKLDVNFYPNLSKTEILRCFALVAYGKSFRDTQIERYRAHTLMVKTNPKQRVMADGILLGRGKVKIKVKHGALRVILPVEQAPQTASEQSLYENRDLYKDQPEADEPPMVEIISAKVLRKDENDLTQGPPRGEITDGKDQLWTKDGSMAIEQASLDHEGAAERVSPIDQAANDDEGTDDLPAPEVEGNGPGITDDDLPPPVAPGL